MRLRWTPNLAQTIDEPFDFSVEKPWGRLSRADIENFSATLVQDERLLTILKTALARFFDEDSLRLAPDLEEQANQVLDEYFFQVRQYVPVASAAILLAEHTKKNRKEPNCEMEL